MRIKRILQLYPRTSKGRFSRRKLLKFLEPTSRLKKLSTVIQENSDQSNSQILALFWAKKFLIVHRFLTISTKK